MFRFFLQFNSSPYFFNIYVWNSVINFNKLNSNPLELLPNLPHFPSIFAKCVLFVTTLVPYIYFEKKEKKFHVVLPIISSPGSIPPSSSKLQLIWKYKTIRSLHDMDNWLYFCNLSHYKLVKSRHFE